MAVYVFLNDTYSDWELGYVMPSLVMEALDPRVIKKNRKVVTFSMTGQPIRSQGNLNIAPDIGIVDIDLDDLEALILPGGMFWPDFSDPKLDQLINRCIEKNKLVAAICAATAYLGKLGLLNSVNHTSNSLKYLKKESVNYSGETFYKDELAVTDKGIITASGLGAVDFTNKILRSLEVFEERVCDAWFNAYKNGVDPSS